MSRTIFYSWQSDLPNSHNRGFISDILKKVIKEVNSSQEYEIDFNLDRDTNGESGSPDIVNTIFQKIRNSEIFVCDISLINKQDSDRRTPNPNVLVELGYAAATLGWENIICFFNEYYGHLKQLPFDIQHRRIITYNINDESNKNLVRDNISKILNKSLEDTGVEYLLRKRRVIKAYSNEPEEAVKIALHQPNFWEFKLSEVLFRHKIRDIEARLDNIDSGIHFVAKKHLDDKHLFDWHRMKLDDMSTLFDSLKIIFEKHWQNSLGAPGEKGDEILILQAINILFDRLNDCIDWEIDIRSIAPPEEIENAFQQISLTLRDIILEFFKIPEGIRKVYTTEQPEEGYDISLKFEFPKESVVAFEEVVRYFRTKLI